MKKSVKLLILFIVLFALGVTYGVTQLKKQDTSTASSGSTPAISVLNIDKDKISKITFKYENKEIYMQKKDNKWSFSDSSYTADDEHVSTILTSISALGSSRLVAENSSDLQSFGLNNPMMTITIILSDGTEKVIQVGNETMGSSYYFKLKDQSKIYVISVADLEAINLFSASSSTSD